MTRFLPLFALLIVTPSAPAQEDKEFDWLNIRVGTEGNIHKQTIGMFSADFSVRAIPDEEHLVVVGVRFGFARERLVIFKDTDASKYADDTPWIPGASNYKVVGTKKHNGKTLFYLEPVPDKKK